MNLQFIASNISNNADLNGLNDSSPKSNKGDKSEVQFCKTIWFMVLSGAIFHSAIGGGAYMMIRNTEDKEKKLPFQLHF